MWYLENLSTHLFHWQPHFYVNLVLQINYKNLAPKWLAPKRPDRRCLINCFTISSSHVNINILQDWSTNYSSVLLSLLCFNLWSLSIHFIILIFKIFLTLCVFLFFFNYFLNLSLYFRPFLFLFIFATHQFFVYFQLFPLLPDQCLGKQRKYTKFFRNLLRTF